jgi:hypothetical protein
MIVQASARTKPVQQRSTPPFVVRPNLAMQSDSSRGTFSARRTFVMELLSHPPQSGVRLVANVRFEEAWRRHQIERGRRSRVSDRASLTLRRRSGRSAGISDGNRDGNDSSHQRPEAAVNNQVLSYVVT